MVSTIFAFICFHLQFRELPKYSCFWGKIWTRLFLCSNTTFSSTDKFHLFFTEAWSFCFDLLLQVSTLFHWRFVEICTTFFCTWLHLPIQYFVSLSGDPICKIASLYFPFSLRLFFFPTGRYKNGDIDLLLGLTSVPCARKKLENKKNRRIAIKLFPDEGSAIYIQVGTINSSGVLCLEGRGLLGLNVKSNPASFKLSRFSYFCSRPIQFNRVTTNLMTAWFGIISGADMSRWHHQKLFRELANGFSC